MTDDPVGTPVPAGSRPATIYDVAQRAGVNASTVSRAFSRPGRVSSDTARRVHEAAKELGYHSDQIFRAPRPTRTRLIGLLVSDVTNPFFFGIIRGAEHGTRGSDAAIVLIDTQEDQQVERRLLDQVLPSIDALVVASSRLSDTALRTAAKHVPVVVLNRRVAGVPSVVSDAAQGVTEMMDLLVPMGHTRFLYVPGPPTSWADGQRWGAIRDQSVARALAHRRVEPVVPTVRGGESAAAAIAERRPDVVVAYNDLVAIGVMRGLAARRIGVPHEVNVVGFDNTFASDLVTPGLTTIAAPLLTLGEHAVRSVLALLDGAPTASDTVVVPVRLVVRGSTGPHK